MKNIELENQILNLNETINLLKYEKIKDQQTFSTKVHHEKKKYEF